MKTLIVYDSVYGNTEKIARAIGSAIAGEVKVLRVGEVDPSEFEKLDLIVIGSPTHAGRPTKPIQDFINKAPASVFEGTKVAAFDTRISSMLARIFGNAAGRISRSLKRKGGAPMASPEGFFVEGTEGPLREGEIERAASWVKEIIENTK